MSALEIPSGKATYILWSRLERARRLVIGRLGEFDLKPGYYGYVGSARGHGGLRARIEHHLAFPGEPRWHMDFLMKIARPVALWYAVSRLKLERDWARLLSDSTRFRIPIARFGSSDYRRSRTSHLFYSRKSPDFRWFQETVLQAWFQQIETEMIEFGGPIVRGPSDPCVITKTP